MKFIGVLLVICASGCASGYKSVTSLKLEHRDAVELHVSKNYAEAYRDLVRLIEQCRNTSPMMWQYVEMASTLNRAQNNGVISVKNSKKFVAYYEISETSELTSSVKIYRVQNNVLCVPMTAPE